MPKLAKELGALEVKGKTAPGLHFVGVVPGLALQVTATGARSWTLRIVIAGKRRDMGLGNYPEVTLATAREKARAARELVRQGVDPIERQQAAASALRASMVEALTFKECAAAYMKAHRAGWKNARHAQQWANTLAQHAYPVIGELLVRDVKLSHVMAVLEPIWTTTNETAVRLRGRIELVLDWAAARGLRDGLNPARWRGHLDKLLPKPSKVNQAEHHAALPVGDIGAFMAQLRAAQGMGARALEFVILTAARSGEVRGATWPEIDRDAKVWTVPAERMKAGKEHRVPLTAEALALLDALPRMPGTDLVFPAPRGGVLSDMTLTAVLRRLDVPAVPHGFRSTFRDWAAERTNYPRDVAEMALAHAIGDKVEAAYRRGDLFQKRRLMMADWAKFLAKPESRAEVIDLNAKRG
ncbi:MAG: integrase arm-type DNA-binding domain-containing protein [Burkholderiales bacterium]|nr:integrase arm-type DNA-binding domain-containing protein [Burkholderiales bacterium]MDE2456822.1 integrase arm-type DNA-binding domain-containing protein [Burkholderiales bacterium]